MHDCKGRVIEVGDHLKFKSFDKGVATIGRVAAVYPGATSCNLGAVHLVPGYYPMQQATLTASDTEIVLKADGSEPINQDGKGDAHAA